VAVQTTLPSTALSYVAHNLTNGQPYAVSLTALTLGYSSSPTVLANQVPKAAVAVTIPKTFAFTFGQVGGFNLFASVPSGATGTATFTTVGPGGSLVTLCSARITKATFGCAAVGTNLPAGTYPVTVLYSGDQSHFGASATTTVTIAKAVPSLQILLSASQISHTLVKNLVVTELLSSANAVHPTGTLTLSIDGTVVSPNAQSFVLGTYVLTHPLSVGSHTFTLSYAGDFNYKGASVSTKLKVT
jgi:hypothetical protein